MCTLAFIPNDMYTIAYYCKIIWNNKYYVLHNYVTQTHTRAYYISVYTTQLFLLLKIHSIHINNCGGGLTLNLLCIGSMNYVIGYKLLTCEQTDEHIITTIS